MADGSRLDKETGLIRNGNDSQRRVLQEEGVHLTTLAQCILFLILFSLGADVCRGRGFRLARSPVHNSHLVATFFVCVPIFFLRGRRAHEDDGGWISNGRRNTNKKMLHRSPFSLKGDRASSAPATKHLFIPQKAVQWTTQKKKPLLSSSCWNDLEEFRVDTGWWLASIGYITQGKGPWFYFVYFGGKFQVAVGRSKQNIFASIKRVCSSGNPLWLLLRDTKAGGKNPGWHHSSALSGRADLYIRGDPVT